MGCIAKQVLIPKLIHESHVASRTGKVGEMDGNTSCFSAWISGPLGTGCLSLFASLGPPGCPG